MARINIEDSLFKDRRWTKLLIKVGCEHKALGILTGAWILAQTHWLKSKSIPQKVWPKDYDVLVECELAVKQDDGSIYVKGSKRAFTWLGQKSESGQNASEKKLKALEKARIARWNRSEDSLNGSERTLNGSEAPTLSLTPTLYSFSDSSSNSDSNIVSEKSKKSLRAAPIDKQSVSKSEENTSHVYAFYCELWKTKYSSLKSPYTEPRYLKNLKDLVKSLGIEQSKVIVEAYLQMRDSWFITKRHDIQTMLSNINPITHFSQTGAVITKAKLRQIETLSANEETMKAIREGVI